ncbi:MAG: RNA-guided pseudouridylation complex pseudouridine synthase subunit Cbf5 [Nanoarchaeales archaeon]|nr:RNA-guided pseudouridylation complex pseudouridine synthase subunit Cbf5 [Nanoarchaeales archaeon]
MSKSENFGNLILKSTQFSCDELGVVPIERTIEELFDRGFVNIDKDCGPTSHTVADSVKHILGSSKTGHSGTLDPKVTGTLVMGLGRATRLMEYMLKSDKVYVCLMYVHKKVSRDDIEKALKKFTGTIMQMPPIVSAVKRQLRPRTIYSIDLLDYSDEGQNVLFKVSCQHGTYIRKLCSDMGEFLGVGAQMAELRRTKAGPFTENDFSISCDKLRNLHDLYLMNDDGSKELDKMSRFEIELRKYVRPMEDLLCEFKKIYVHDSSIDSLSHGYDLAVPGVSRLSPDIKKDEKIAVLSSKGELIAMGTAIMDSDEIMKASGGMCSTIDKVFMDVGYYPKIDYFKEKYPEQFIVSRRERGLE